MRGEFVDVGGARIYYYASGTRGPGEPILFLHGFPASSHVWSRLVPLLPKGHRVVVMDLLGYGRSDRPNGAVLSLGAHADRVLRFLDVLGIQRSAVVGHGLGGGIAVDLAIRFPTRVSKLCLVDIVAFDAWLQGVVRLLRTGAFFFRHLPPGVTEAILRSHLTRGYSGDGIHSVEQFLRPFGAPDGREALMAHLGALDVRETHAQTPALKGVNVPTAIVWGADDPFLPLSLGQRLQAQIPGATLDVVAGGRHFVPEESPERCADVRTTFPVA